MKSSQLAIRTEAVTKRFGHRQVLHDVSLEVQSGETYGFLGPNGAGKTTTISCLMDFIRPTSGSITILGRDARRDSVELKRQIGYVPADPQLYPKLTGHQHLRLYEQLYGPATDAAKLASHLDLDLTAQAGVLSTGNKQKLAFFLAMAGRPQLLILDEPTKGLDPLLQEQIYGALKDFRAGGGTIFISSHNLAEVQKVCDRVGIIKDGRLIASESLGNLIGLAVHEVKIEFSGPIKPELFQAKNIEIASHNSHRLYLRVHGDLNPLLAKLAAHSVKDLEITHASLEDVFMKYYRGDQ